MRFTGPQTAAIIAAYVAGIIGFLISLYYTRQYLFALSFTLSAMAVASLAVYVIARHLDMKKGR